MKLPENRLYLWSVWLAAGLLVFLLPFTSFPPVARITGSSMVAPLSILPLLVLLVVWLAPYFLRGGKISSQITPLLGFLAVCLVSTALAFFLPIPPYKTATLQRSSFEALASIAVGCGFYLFVSVWARDEEKLVFLFRCINWGGILALGWAIFQAAVWQFYGVYPDWMWNLQGKISTSLLLYSDRVNGLAFEPSWLAHQLNMLYLPFWLSASINRFSAHKVILKMSLENILLVAGTAVLVMTVSRIGLLALLFILAYLVLMGNIRLVNWLTQIWMKRFVVQGLRTRIIKRVLILTSFTILLLFYLGVIAGAAYGLSRYDVRMQKIFDFTLLKEQSFLHYANQLVFVERVVFWQAGWEVFNDYPILGVGPGNAGYFFPEKLSAFSWALTEVRTLMYQWTTLPNIKSLWVRLLAETGMVGFAFFSGWLYILWNSAGFLRSNLHTLIGKSGGIEIHSRLILYKMIGWMGAFVLVGFVIEAFSMDTFALPYYWVSFGLVTAACEQSRRAAQGRIEQRQMQDQ